MRYSTLGIQVTNTCDMACPHCITDSSPSARGDLDWDEIERTIRSAAAHVDGICVTGGEPLLKRDLTFGIIQLTRELGLISSLVTNGYWARSRQDAERIVTELEAAGLDKLAVSYDQFHDRLVSPASLERLTQVGSRTSMELRIQYCGAQQDAAYRTAREVADRYGVELTTAEVLPFGRGRDLVAGTVSVDLEAVPDEPCGVVTRPVLIPEGELFTDRMHECGLVLIDDVDSTHPYDYGQSISSSPDWIHSTTVSATDAPDQRDTPEQVRVRHGKLDRMRESGIDPYQARTSRTTSVAEMRRSHGHLGPDEHTGTRVGLAGRITLSRDSGKLCFATLSEQSGEIQLMLSLDRLGQQSLTDWKSNVDLGASWASRGK